MTDSQSNASKKSPLFTLQPIVILDIVRVCENGIQREERDGVDMKVPRNRLVQRSPDDFRRLYLYGNPGIHSSADMNLYIRIFREDLYVHGQS